MVFSVDKIIALRDNYVYFITDGSTGDVAVVDPSEPGPVIDYCVKHNVRPKFVMNTHHHWDHVGGNLALQSEFGARVVGYRGDADRIPGIDIALNEGDTFELGRSSFDIMHTPGHTTGHIVYYSKQNKALFCGDAMFSMGCGGNFEGTYRDLFDSLTKLKSLPDDTLVYCGHEYTAMCWRSATSLEGNTEALIARGQEIREKNTIPTSIAKEKATNPFLRWDSIELRKRLGLLDASDFEVFCAVRTGA